MKKTTFIGLLTLAAMVLISGLAVAQEVVITHGPEIGIDQGGKIKRMIDGDKNSFYCYRPSGQNNVFYLEKYDKKTLNKSFTREIEVEGLNVKPAGVFYAMGNVYIFNSIFDSLTCKVMLVCRTISASGEISSRDLQVSFDTDNEFADIGISMNPGSTAFLIKACYRITNSQKHTTDFILVKAGSLETAWKKNVEQRLIGHHGFNTGGEPVSGPGITYLGCSIDDNENLAYCYLDNSKSKTGGDENNSLKLAVFHGPALAAATAGPSATGAMQKPLIIDLSLSRKSSIAGIALNNNVSNRLVVGGFFRDMNEGEPLLTSLPGIFSFKVDLSAGKIESQQVRVFDPEFTRSLQNAPVLMPFYQYKMDDIFSVGSDLFFVGQLFAGKPMADSEGTEGGIPEQMYEYSYCDVIVAKLNADGAIEWLKNAPVRTKWQANSNRVSNSYFAVPSPNGIYVFHNDNPLNFNAGSNELESPIEWQNIRETCGSTFLYSVMADANRSSRHQKLMKNESFCWTPFQKPDPSYRSDDAADIFLHGTGNEIFICTESPGKERFSRLNIR